MVAYSAELTTGHDGRPAYRAWYQNYYQTWQQVCDRRGMSRPCATYREALAQAKEAWEASRAARLI